MTQAPGRKDVRVFPPPPKGFAPLTATKTELARHGLPPRPDRETQPVQAALWEHIANRYASFEHLQPDLSPLDTRAPATTDAGIAPFALDRFSACGFQLFAPVAAPFQVLAATWTVPNLKHKTNPFGPNQFHTFLALGFLDLHVSMTVDAAENVTVAFGIAGISLPLSPGDVVSAVLCSPGEPEGPNQSPSACFLANETSRQTVNVQFVTGFRPAVRIEAGIGRSSNPNFPPQLQPLARFGAVYFDDITANGTQFLTNGQPTTMIDFPDPPGNTLARPVKLNDRAFKIVYEGD